MADVLAVKLFFFQPMKGHNDKTLGVKLVITNYNRIFTYLVPV